MTGWNFSATNEYLEVATPLTKALNSNPSLRVFLACGYQDLATPSENMDYSVRHMDLPPALRGAVIDLFPAAADRPCRVDHDDGVIRGLRSYDPLTQRTVAETDHLTLDPASELVTARGAALERAPGAEHRLPRLLAGLETLSDHLPAAATLLLEEGTDDRATAFLQAVADAHATSEVLLALSCDSREDVDAIATAAADAGGKADIRETVDMGWLYNRAFQDRDGHTFEAVWADMSAAPAEM